MAKTQDWRQNRKMWVRVLERQTGQGVHAWNARIKEQRLGDERSLRAWLSAERVTGYAQSLLVMEQFGYPEFILATADRLIDKQYADRAQLRPICDAIIEAATGLGNIVIQARKTYISLVSPRRTFARIVPTTRDRLDLGLRLEKQKPAGRLQRSRIHETMRLQVSLTALVDVDAEVRGWLRKAYVENS